MKKLQILIPHYKEDFSVIKPLLDSINIQQNINFDDIGVIIVNDGNEVIIDKNNFNNYNYEIQYYINEHKGVSATRNACLDKAEAEYVMFCDCDDMFSNVCGLWCIFREMSAKNSNEEIIGFDILVSVFMQESHDPKTNTITYINRGDKDKDGLDSVFVHGKAYRRQYLLDNNIRWCDKLTIHEDSYFNCLCQTLTKNIKYISTPFYLWKWRGESVCRSDEKYILKTYTNLLDSSDALVEQFILRKKLENAQYNITHMIYNTYFTMNTDEWLAAENRPYRLKTEKHFKRYYNKYSYLMNGIKPEVKMQIIKTLKTNFFNKGLIIEKFSFEDWIRYIQGLKDE